MKRKMSSKQSYTERVARTSVGKYTYEISQFEWDARTRTFSANEDNVWVKGYNFSFPSGKKEFYILNPATGGYRRFRLYKDLDNRYLFLSDDGILCRIDKNISKTQLLLVRSERLLNQVKTALRKKFLGL